MLRSLIICPDAGLARQLESAVSVASEVTIARTLDRYPGPVDLARSLRAHAPDVLFISFESPEKAIELVKFVEIEAEGVQIVAVHSTCDARVLRETMRAGVREFLGAPFERQAVLETLRNVKEMVERKPPAHQLTNQIFAFLPSKAGVGASTLALNIKQTLQPLVSLLLQCGQMSVSGLV